MICSFAAPAFSKQDSLTVAKSLDLPDAFASYGDVVSWIKAWETPEQRPLPAECIGVWIALRWSGRLQAEFADASPALDASNAAGVLPGAVRKVMYRAIERAKGTDGDAVERADRVERFRELPCSVEVQFAHRMTRLRGVDSAAITNDLRPGIDGVLLRINGKARALFPGAMLAQEQTPATAVQALRFELELTEEEFDNQIADGTIRMWKFEIFHLAQPEPNAPAIILNRGSQVVPANAMNVREVQQFSNDLATHLQERMWPGDEPLGIMGVYLADVDRYEPLTANSRDQVLAALALARYAHWQRPTAPSRAQKAESTALKILDDLVVRANTNVNPIPVVGIAAMFAITVDELSTNPNLKISPEIRAARVTCQSFVESVYLPNQQQFNESVPSSEQAVCAMALGTRDAVGAVWQNTAMHLQPSLLPWLGWAEMKLAPEGGPIGASAGLKALRLQLWATQHGTMNFMQTEPDLMGGLALGNGDQPPDWQTARPLAFLATMLGDPRLTDRTDMAELNAEIVNLTNALRFLRQLSVRDVDRYRLPNPQRALHGIRSILWSEREPISASAMTLMALTEFCKSLDAIQSQQQSAADKPANTGQRR